MSVPRRHVTDDVTPQNNPGHESNYTSIMSLSQDSSVRTYPCRWHWCIESFSDNAALVGHVLKEHVHKAKPIKRLDIPLFRRAEEGSGESYKVPYLLHSQTSPASPRKSPGRSPRFAIPSSDILLIQMSDLYQVPSLHRLYLPHQYRVPWGFRTPRFCQRLLTHPDLTRRPNIQWRLRRFNPR